MTDTALAFFGVAVLFALLDWLAVARNAKVLEYVAKPATTAGLVGVAAALDVPREAPWVLLIVALVFCLAGDIFLMLPHDAFIPGLGSFAVAQLLFASGFVAEGINGIRLVVGLVVVAPAAVLLGRRFLGAIRRSGRTELVVPVAAYLLVISAMAVASVAAGSIVAVAGAVTFMASDSLIAESRFVAERRWHSVGIMVTYHLALAGLVFGLA